METETSSVHWRLLLTCAGGISATLLGLVAMAELLASSQFLAASNEKRKSTCRKCQTMQPIDGEGNENENNDDSDNELGEDQDVLENGDEGGGKNAPTKDGANGEDAGNENDNDDGGSDNSGNGGDEEDNDDGGSDDNDEDNNDDDDDVDEEDVEEDNFEGEDDEETLPPPKKRKK